MSVKVERPHENFDAVKTEAKNIPLGLAVNA
jgi:hypothetical protein